MNDMLRERWEEKINPDGAGAFLQESASLAHEHFHDVFSHHHSDFIFLQESSHRGIGMSNDECFHQFNPGNEDEFKSVTDNWSNTYFDMSTMIVNKLKGKTQAPVAQPVASNVSVAAVAVPQADPAAPTKSPEAALSEMETMLRLGGQTQWSDNDSF